MSNKDYNFPFAAVIGQEQAKRALILNVVNPSIGGVLLSGEKGTAKSTLVRGLTAVSEGMQVVDLPLNATEDRVVGTIDIEKTITVGKRCFEYGLLKNAHHNIVYVDEVNLLSEHIVNCLLEASVSGINRVEREGISFTHPARFILVGTMNEEEGLLRPQFLDRFGLYVEIKGEKNLSERKEIIRRRLQYEKDPETFLKEWLDATNSLSERVKKGKAFLNMVVVSEHVMRLAAEIAMEANCSGHRADLVIIETARAMAAYDGRKSINIGDIKEAAEYVLPHRKNNPGSYCEQQEQPPESTEQQEPPPPADSEGEQPQQEQEDTAPEDDSFNTPPQETENSQRDNNVEDNDVEDQVDDIGDIFRVKDMSIRVQDKKKRLGDGKRVRTQSSQKKGHYVRYVLPKGKLTDIAVDATIRAAAPYQRVRQHNGMALVVARDDFREKMREKRTGSTIVFVVDASSSMGAYKRMSAVKGAIMSLLTDAYQKRDKVGLVAFRKKEAEVLLSITRSVDLAQKCLKSMPTGGKTPLAAGLIKGYEVIKLAQKKDKEILPVIVLISDGRSNAAIWGGDPISECLEVAAMIRREGIQAIVVDTEKDYIKLGLAREVASTLDAHYYKLEELEAMQLAHLVKECVS